MNYSTFNQILRLQVVNHACLGAQKIIDLMTLYKREAHESRHCKLFITEKSLLGRTYSVKLRVFQFSCSTKQNLTKGKEVLIALALMEHSFLKCC